MPFLEMREAATKKKKKIANGNVRHIKEYLKNYICNGVHRPVYLEV